MSARDIVRVTVFKRIQNVTHVQDMTKILRNAADVQCLILGLTDLTLNPRASKLNLFILNLT